MKEPAGTTTNVGTVASDCTAMIIHACSLYLYERTRQDNLQSAAPMVRLVTSIVVVTLAALTSRAQEPERIEFDVVSIKRNTSDGGGSSARTLPDGTTISINRTIQSMVMAASPEPVREVEGLPD